MLISSQLIGFGVASVLTAQGVDQIPTMTAATTSGVTMSATSDNATYEAWKAGDKQNSDTHWWVANGAAPQILKVDFGSTKNIFSYSIASRSDAARNDPVTWTFQGSPDDSAWTTLDTQTTAPAWSAAETRTYTLASYGSFRYFRLNVTAVTGGSTNLAIGELRIFN